MKTSAVFFAVSISAVSFFSSAAAHGFVSSMVIGGKTYTGPSPYTSSKAATPIRKITSINPITDVNSAAMTCGTGATTGLASIVAPAQAGSSISFTWKSGTGNWGHSVGPIETYMALCDGPCETFNPKSADFFKIAETGRKPNSMDWYQADIKAGKAYTTTIPAHIPSGDYIIRHELIALHFATSMNGAQFYPSCSQVRVTGGSSAKSLAASTNVAGAKFPGAYHTTDKGIYVPDIYTSKNYVFPGPKVATFAAGSIAAPVPLGTTTSASAAAAPTSTHVSSARFSTSSTHVAATHTAPSSVTASASSAAPSSTSKTCKKKAIGRRARAEAAKRHINANSRVMRSLHDSHLGA